ncbi:three-Cys-motif partner protein [Amycolatopsis sulphurea]|uniref:Three-Cys-motif partner protein n=1 Tax=Amycolatopsis sulphurea TaxID=76022 RepID=A0A2A9FAU2_9PSEU|nr:three-Cys-motif partner protein TcmP [Amycolatopsis sulphurea]PFG48464.1 three-Cys-motif partner protein [Amycolatopsis sulphurea]
MADKLDTVWQLEPHTKAKHDILRRYLHGWFPVLSRYNGRIIFLDGFAGPGVYKEGEPGSPKVALEALLQHRYDLAKNNCEFLLVFNEQDPDRYAVLNDVIEELKQGEWPPHVKVSKLNENFQDLAEDIVEYLDEQRANLAPTLAFLDPFGYQDTPIEKIKRLLSFNKCELLIYFDYNSANRFGTAGNVDEHFEALFGTDEFKDAPPAGDPERGKFFVDLYERQLKAVCEFDYVQRFQMINRDGRTPYYLFYCTRSLKGVEIMKDAMWSVAPDGGYRFSDRLAGQDVLFQDQADTQPLRKALLAEFSGKTVSIAELERFVLVNTPYKKTHLKQKTLAPMSVILAT